MKVEADHKDRTELSALRTPSYYADLPFTACDVNEKLVRHLLTSPGVAWEAERSAALPEHAGVATCTSFFAPAGSGLVLSKNVACLEHRQRSSRISPLVMVVKGARLWNC
nr:hypothetical protein CFP56_65848 [Quercus suber]